MASLRDGTATAEPLPLAPAQAAQAAGLLARAFLDDPAWLWAIPDDATRTRILPWFFRAAIEYGLRYGEVHTTHGVDSTAILLPPEHSSLDPLRLMRVGLLPMVFKAGIGAFSRFLTMRRELEERHKEDVPPRHWYAWLLGVDPPRQRQGVGSTLLRPLTERADVQRVPCYLDTTRERNLAFYGKLGFQVVFDGAFSRGGPRYWTLRREPHVS